MKKGFENPEHIDIDSTVQIPDMQYPATVNLLVKAAAVGRRIQKILMRTIPEVVKAHIPEIDMKAIKGVAKQHYFEKMICIPNIHYNFLHLNFSDETFTLARYSF